jgi:hypothetical protein
VFFSSTLTASKAPVTISRALSGFFAQILPNSEIGRRFKVLP